MQGEEEPGQARCRDHELVLVRRAEDGVAERERTVRLVERDLRGREHPDRPARAIHDREMLDPGVEHVDRGLDRELLGCDDDRGHGDPRHGLVGRHVTDDDATPQRSVGDDLEPRAPETRIAESWLSVMV